MPLIKCERILLRQLEIKQSKSKKGVTDLTWVNEEVKGIEHEDEKTQMVSELANMVPYLKTLILDGFLRESVVKPVNTIIGKNRETQFSQLWQKLNYVQHLEMLSLRDCGITDKILLKCLTGWHFTISYLQDPRCSQRRSKLPHNLQRFFKVSIVLIVTKKSISMLVDVYMCINCIDGAGFCNVRLLDLSGNHDITSVGWKGLADTLVENQKSRLINLIYQNGKYAIDQTVGEQFAEMFPSLIRLDLSMCSITDETVRIFHAALSEQTDPEFVSKLDR